MKLKSYFSGTVEAALELARKELGEEALLVNARPATPETRSLGAFEVVFGIPDHPHTAGDPAAATPAPHLEVNQLRRDFASLKREVGRMVEAFRETRSSTSCGNTVPAALATLLEAGLDASLAQQVMEGTAVQDLFQTDTRLGKADPARSIVALIGPPGAGKTTSLVKLAARYGIAAPKPAHIISTDVHRIAAAAQLETLAAILGIGFEVVETSVALSQALEAHRSKGLILIDTPGFGPRDMEDAIDLAELLAEHPEVDKHLTLPAFLECGDMARISDRFQMFHPDKLLFTHLDETERYGALISESVRTSLPISFLANGQRIPDDLELASRQVLAGLVAHSANSPLGELDSEDIHAETLAWTSRPTEASLGSQPKRIGAAA